MRLTILALATAAMMSGPTLIAQDKPTGDAQLIQGIWDWDPAAKQSDAQPVILVEGVDIEGDMLTFRYSMNGKKFRTPTKFALDSTAKPKTIDFTPTAKDNSNKGKIYLGLYEISKGQLRICYRGPESTRPKNFEDKVAGNNGTMYITLKPRPKA